MSDKSPIKKHTITFEMLSDWHIGTGSGIPGSVDALVARDADGFPCLPAKTVVGIWRDALETLTFGLDSGNAKDWQNWVDVIFGSQPNIDKNPNDTPRPAILSIQPARIDENLRKAIKGDVKLEQALTFVKPNTAIENESGTAKTDSLRFTEMGRIGSVLESDFELDFSGFEDDAIKLVKALLTASASLVERIGGNRRRGSGRCAMKIVCGEIDGIAVLKKYQNGLTLKLPEIQPKNELESAEKDDSVEWNIIEYSLKLETPVAIVTNTLGNVSETLDFIPGTYLLPHITKHLKVSKYVASGDFQVLPATICIEGNRGLPVPKVIWYHKVEGGFGELGTVYNKIKEPKEVEDLTNQKKNYREGYVSDLGETDKQLPFYETTKKILLMHNTVEDEFQRPTENVGGVFSRQAIQAGQVLRGEIRLKKSIFDDLTEQDEKWIENLNSYVRLGTSKKDDYGLADLTILDELQSTTSELKDNKLVVYLASDVLLRNGNLRQTNLVCDLRNELEKTLGAGSLKCTEKSLIQVRRIESWHEGWGFPRPTFTAMAAGSVAVFEIDKFDEIEKAETRKSEFQTNLRNLELSGIGERRGEGYGQIKFNPKILTGKINTWTISAKADKPKFNVKERQEAIENLQNRLLVDGIIGDTKFKEFIENIELSTWREEIARAVLKIANDEGKRLEIFGFESKTETPSMSQIGGLRSAIGRLKETDDANVLGYLEHLEDTPNRLKRWGSNTEKGSVKIQKIKALISDDRKVWLILIKTKLDGARVWKSPKTIIRMKKELRKELWAEAVKSLFDACARAHKRSTEDN